MIQAARSALACLIALALFVAAPAARAGSTRITGQVIDAETLAPISDADVELQNQGGGPGYHRTRSDARGEFVLEGVSTNRYYVFTVGAAGFTDWALDGWQFPSAQREVRIVVPLDRAGVLSLHVSGADGKTAVAGARVEVSSERDTRWSDGSNRGPDARYTSKSGDVTFAGLRAGSWTVQVQAAGLRNGESRGVAVRRGETTALRLTLSRPASVSGAVRLADSTGVAGVNVVARGPGEATATTDAGGFYTLGDLAPGRYRIEVQHDGLEPGVFRDNVTLKEGEARELGTLRVRPRVTSLAFVLGREVFAPAEKQQIGVRAFRLAAIDFTLWRIPEERLLDATHDFRAAYVQGSDTTGLVRVQAWRHELSNGPPFAWREAQMPLPNEQPAGAYVLEGRAGPLARRVVFFVSDLGLLVKRSPTQTLVWAGSLRTGLPLPNTTILSAGVPGHEDRTGSGGGWSAALAAAHGRGAVTDADGLCVLPGGGPETIRLVGACDGHGVAIAQPPLAGAAQQGGDRMFLFTERPIYRPGQVIDWKLFARTGAADGYTLPAAGSVTLALRGPDEASLDVPLAQLSAAGSADGVVTLPQELPLGDWTLSASWGHTSASASIAIQQYRKPEYKVEVTPEHDVLVNGDEARFQVAANYFFGAPVVGAHVRYTLFETRIPGEELWAEGEGEDGGEGGGYGRMLESGETRTDIDGRVTVSFTPQRVAYDRRLSLEVEVTDASQRSVSSRGAVTVGRGLYVVQLKPVSPLFMAGQPLVVDVITKDHKGNPVQAAVRLELDQDVWSPIERRYTRSSRPLASVTGTTSVLRGVTRLTVSPASARYGYLTLRAFSDDARGNRITAETGIWNYDASIWEYPYRYPSLEAIADKDEYAPGDTARILVNTDVRDAAVLVTVEGRDIRDPRVVHLFGNSGLVKVVIRAAEAPNVFVAIHVRRGAEVHSRVLELKVRSERHDLAITLGTDKPQYRPREKAKLHVETKNAAGQPVAAEVALGVVDEAIYALRADATPDAHDIFYGRRANWVTTVVSFPTLYYGGADKGDHGDVRRDFRDVALWAPTLSTGPTGSADVEVTFPDNLTTWRTTARGMTAGTLVGSATAKTLVSKDVVARLALPRAFVAGDEALLASVVNNRSAQSLTGVGEALEVKGAARLTGPANATTSMAAGGEARADWAVATSAESPRDGSDASATFLFRAKAAHDADALEQSVPVLPRAVALQLQGAGRLESASQSLSVTLPADLVRTGSSLTVQLAGSPAAIALSASTWLLGYPYGCTEQTVSALMPAATLVSAARLAHVTLPGWGAPEARLAPYVQHLLALRAPEGGWGWWGNDEADAYFTSLAIDGLACAAAAGIQRDACLSAIREATWPLQRLLQDVRSVDGEAYCALHLSGIARIDNAAQELADLQGAVESMGQSAYNQRDRLGDGGLACAALAMHRLHHVPEAKALVALLLAKGTRDAAGLHFGDAGDPWLGDGTEAAALALSAVAAVAPADPAGPEIVRALVARRVGGHWKNTRVSGQAALALAEWLAAHPSELAGTTGAHVTLGDKRVLDLPAGTGNPFSAASVTLPGARLAAGANALRVERDGDGAVYWAWDARANVPSPGPLTKDARLSIRREYLLAERTTDRRGRPRWLTHPIDPAAPVRIGETVLVRLTLAASAPLGYLLIEDPKPAGFEIDQVLPDGADRPYGTWGEVRDDRAAFFVRHLEDGETAIEYLLRPEVPGTFTALPASAGSMYDPGLLVRGGEAKLRIVGR